MDITPTPEQIEACKYLASCYETVDGFRQMKQMSKEAIKEYLKCIVTFDSKLNVQPDGSLTVRTKAFNKYYNY